jgi:hypothetical protein
MLIYDKEGGQIITLVQKMGEPQMSKEDIKRIKTIHYGGHGLYIFTSIDGYVHRTTVPISIGIADKK